MTVARVAQHPVDGARPRSSGHILRGPARALVALAATLACVAGVLLVVDSPASAATPSPEPRFWGLNSTNNFGNGTTVNSNTPVSPTMSGALAGLNVYDVATGTGTSCAIAGPTEATAKVFCWGTNTLSMATGDGVVTQQSAPAPVGTATAFAGKYVTHVAVGANSTCAVTTDEQVWCWGSNSNGQLGVGPVNVVANSATQVTGLPAGDVLFVTAGTNFNCAILDTVGGTYCWGLNTTLIGQIGNNNNVTTNVTTATQVTGSILTKTPASISAGVSHTCATANDGTTHCWGLGTSGQIGDNAGVSRLQSTQVTGALTVNSTSVVQAGAATSCSLTTVAGTVTPYCWGAGALGQLGNNTVAGSNTPVQVTTSGALSGKTPASITMGSGGASTCLLATNGKVYCWGNAANWLAAQTVPLALDTSGSGAGIFTLIEGGTSTWSGIWQGYNAPGAPTAVNTGVPGNQQIPVSWTAPADNGGSPVTSYTATASPGGATCTSASTSCTVTGLTNGTDYTFTVTATNEAGTSSASAASAPPVAPRTVPGSPTSLSATPGAGQADVSWTAPVSNGGSALTNYTVTSSPGGLTCNAVPPTTTCSVMGLTNGTSYTFTAKATNAAGDSAASAPSSPVTPRTVPDAPSGVTGSPGDQQVAVSWTAPASDGGYPILSYTATASPGGQTCNAVAPATTCNVAGLTNGTPYTFTVNATNTAGTGADSPASAAVTPRTTPGPPSGVIGTPGDSQVAVTWTAPGNGGSPIQSYTVTAAPGGAGCTSLHPITGCTVTGLTNGTPYTFTVTATNAAGTGTGSASAPVTPLGAPGKPTAANATPGTGQANVSWTAPASDGGSPVLSYTATASPGGNTCGAVAPAVSCTVIGLANGTSYTFTITATNSVATGPASNPSSPITPGSVPDAPTSVVGVPGNTSVDVSWLTPMSDGGSPITAYTVTAAPGGNTCSPVLPALTCTVNGLTNGTSYAFTVTATNGVGTGSPSIPSSGVTPRTTPGAPTGLSAATSSQQASLSWTPPGSDGGSPITGYTVTAQPGGATCSTIGTTCSVTGLANGTPYSFTVTATNAAGSGPASAPAIATPLVAPVVPDAPSGVFGTPGDRQVTVAWDTPQTDGGSAILNYTVTASPGGATCLVAAPATSCTITGLSNGTAYTMTVTATNGVGTGPASPASAAVTPATVPSSPVSVAAAVAPPGTVAAVSWGAPTSDNGSSIISYTATSAPGNRTCTVVATQTGCTVTGLDPGTSYTFSVVASNSIGSSAPSAASLPITAVSVAVSTRVTSGRPVAGRPSTFQATVSTSTGAPTGTVTFRLGNGTRLCVATVIDGVATCRGAVPGGMSSISALFNGVPVAASSSTLTVRAARISLNGTLLAKGRSVRASLNGQTKAKNASVTVFQIIKRQGKDQTRLVGRSRSNRQGVWKLKVDVGARTSTAFYARTGKAQTRAVTVTLQ